MSFRTQGVQGLVNRGGVYITIYNSIPCTGDTIYVNDELYQFDLETNDSNSITLTGNESIIGSTTDWTLTGTTVTSGSVVITDALNVSGYIENYDYTVNYDEGIITRSTTGRIEDLDIIKINYSWHIDCIDEKTGAPYRYCKTCLDPEQGDYPTGVIYNTSTRMKGLFHIPNHNSPFEKSGVWKLGDGVVSVPYDVEVNAKNYSDGGFFCMDKIKIEGQPGIWKVMSLPQTIQMGEFLGKRIHIRKIDFK
jgi:hypothetical protein